MWCRKINTTLIGISRLVWLVYCVYEMAYFFLLGNDSAIADLCYEFGRVNNFLLFERIIIRTQDAELHCVDQLMGLEELTVKFKEKYLKESLEDFLNELLEEFQKKILEEFLRKKNAWKNWCRKH